MFRILVTRQTMGNPYVTDNPHSVSRPWVAICQDHFPSMGLRDDDDGVLPPHYGETKEEALDGLKLTILERVNALGMRPYGIVEYEP
jgi:hypothetical protein